MSDKPQGVKVEALRAHTYQGKEYQVGDTYTFYPSTNPSGISADAQVDSLLSTGFAVRVDRAAVAKAQAKEAEKTVKARAKAAVEPMTTENTGAAVTPTKRAAAPKAPKAPKSVAKAVKAKK